jgi:hypothetical protein
MRLYVISESDYDNTTIHGIVKSFDDAVLFVRSMHTQKTLTIETDVESITAKYRGGVSYYDVKDFFVDGITATKGST